MSSLLSIHYCPSTTAAALHTRRSARNKMFIAACDAKNFLRGSITSVKPLL